MENNYKKILMSAEKLFTEQGYERTTMDQIAKSIGLSKGALYYFFHNKSDLFCRIVDTRLEELESCIDYCRKSVESNEIIAEQVIRKYVNMAYDNSRIVLMILGGQMFGESSPVGELLQPRLYRLQNTVEQIITLGTQNGFIISTDIKTAAKAFWGMVYGIIALPEVPSREQTVSAICDLLANGLYCSSGRRKQS